jgi:O-methyltransferase involved in polyketide biosynthesis
MINQKRALIGNDINPSNHQLVTIDALAETGVNSLNEFILSLSKEKGLAIISEGLFVYFEESDVRRIWSNFSKALNSFSNGVYISDLRLGDDNKGYTANLQSKLLSLFVRGKVNFHFKKDKDAQKALIECTFTKSTFYKPSEWGSKIKHCNIESANLVKVFEAEV